MPVGRFRDDPRELDPREQTVHARQYPEGLLVVGTLLGTLLRLGFDVGVLPAASPAVTNGVPVVGVFAGGVGCYLLGYLYRERKLRRVGDAASTPAGRDARTTDDAAGDGRGEAVEQESGGGE